jgi:hypothetical protein
LYWKEFLPNNLLKDEELFGETNDTSAFADLDALEDLNDFIEDDDGNGYMEDLRNDQDLKKYHQRSREQMMQKLSENLTEEHQKQDSCYQVQSSFQTASCPPIGKKQILCNNELI